MGTIRIYWKWIIKSIPGLLVGLLMWASQVTPQQASSNIAAWLIYFGIDDPPTWVTNRSIDKWVFWGGLVGAIAWGIFLWSRYKGKNVAAGEMKDQGAILRIKYTDEAANRRYMRFEGNGGVCTWYLEIVNESLDTDAQEVEIKVESYDQIPDLLYPHTRTAAFTPVGIVLTFE